MGKKVIEGEIGYEITLKSIEDGEDFLINSLGGDLLTGLALYDFVKGSTIDVGVVGSAMSAATLPLIASSTRWGTPNSRYLIHNPYTMGMGEQKHLRKAADYLEFEQNRAVDLYVEALSIPKEQIIALMDENRIIDAQEALTIGLIKEIKELNAEETPTEGGEVNNNYKNEDEMSKEQIENQKSIVMKAIDKLNGLLKGGTVKMLVLQDVNGENLDFGDQIETEDQIVVGLEGVTVDGSPANGNYVMNDGRTMVFENGTLTAIETPVEETDENAELKAENEELKAQNEELNAQLKKSQDDSEALKEKFSAEMTQLKDEVAKLSELSTGEVKTINVPAKENEGSEKPKFSFKSKKRK